MAMVTTATLDRLVELEQRLGALGLDDYRDAVDEALHALDQRRTRLGSAHTAGRVAGSHLTAQQRRRTLALGRKADSDTLTPAERAEYETLIREAERRAAHAALTALSERSPEQAAALGARAAAVLGR